MNDAILSGRRLKFTQQYPIDFNGQQAAIRAGYSPKSAHVTASRLLNDAKVQEAIAAHQVELTRRAEVTADRILEEVDTLGLGEIGEVLDFSGEHVCLRPANQITEKGRRLLAAMKVKRSFQKGPLGLEPVEVIEFKLWDKPVALRLALQHRGLLIQKHELTGKDGAALPPTHITVTLVKPDDHGGD